MKFLKLALISILVFYMLIWGITLLFPNVTVMSRVVTIEGKKDSLVKRIKSNEVPFNRWLTTNNPSVDVRKSDISFYENDLFNSERQLNADTIYFDLQHERKSFMQGGIGLYQLLPDSTTTQLFYVFRTKWYKPWEKMAGIANETKYGGQMDSALLRLKQIMEKEY